MSHSKSCVSSYIKKKDHLNLECSKSAQSKKKVVASVHVLMDDAARVRSLEYAVAFDSFTSKREAGMITASVSDTYLQRNAAHQGFLSQANHAIHRGVNYQQSTEFKAAILTLEQNNCGSMMTSSGVNLSSLRAAKQRAKNTGPLVLLGVSQLADEATGDSGSGIGSIGGGGRPNGSGHAAVIDLVAVGSGRSHSVTPARLKHLWKEKTSPTLLSPKIAINRLTEPTPFLCLPLALQCLSRVTFPNFRF